MFYEKTVPPHDCFAQVEQLKAFAHRVNTEREECLERERASASSGRGLGHPGDGARGPKGGRFRTNGADAVVGDIGEQVSSGFLVRYGDLCSLARCGLLVPSPGFQVTGSLRYVSIAAKTDLRRVLSRRSWCAWCSCDGTSRHVQR